MAISAAGVSTLSRTLLSAARSFASDAWNPAIAEPAAASALSAHGPATAAGNRRLVAAFGIFPSGLTDDGTCNGSPRPFTPLLALGVELPAATASPVAAGPVGVAPDDVSSPAQSLLSCDFWR